ncbi:MAG: S9 family peptidase [Dysgonamonadaceae bacterium]|jgi:dipeptidyl aminopeptidase/acylaminoacyl peptidase|nr:S9 family peptidase [Dysgonamonadaceae bacterium]
MTIVTIFQACNVNNKQTSQSETIINKKPVRIEDGRLNAEILQTLGQVAGVAVSPDNQQILYGVTYTDIASNKRNRELFIVNRDGTDKKKITSTPKSESEAQWVKNGGKIAFLYDNQLWEMNPDGSNRKQISRIENGIEAFKYAPDGSKILFISTVKSGERTVDRYPDLEKAKGRIIDDLMYKHWDEWVESIPHPFVADYKDNALSNITDLLDREPYESPLRPMGGIEQLDWSPDSKTIAYTCRKKTGKAYSQSTNSDIFLYNVETKTTTNLTEGNGGYDTNPAFSPDGKQIAWLSMERDGYESDKNRLFVTNLDTGEKAYITKTFDYDVHDFCWAVDSESIFFLSCVKGTTHIYSTNVKIEDTKNNTRVFTPITDGDYDYASVALADDCLIALRHSLSGPNEVYCLTALNSEQTTPYVAANISHENDDILAQITMGKVEERWIKTTDGKEMLTWVVYPPQFDPQKKYPAILYCQGGPQNTVSQFWSTRWNLQIMAAHDYIIVAPNRRGVPGFGAAWNEQISGDYGGQNMKDYFSAIDALAKEPYIDENRLGCTGASYGGFSVYWLAGHHNKRFKAFWAHAGIFNLEAQYLETEEMWFADWDLGGPFWDKSNKTAQQSFADSPHRFVDQWDTPIAISCGELDYRILASQGMMAFNAAQLRGIPSRMLIYPDENHWILKPQNAVLFQREFFRWFDSWLKD